MKLSEIDFSTVKIEKGIPLPPPSQGRELGPIHALLSSLEIGDSFLVPFALKDKRVKVTIHNILKKKKKENGREYTTRADPNGFRIFRTA